MCWYLYFSSNTDLGSSQILTKRQWYLCNTRTTKNQQISICKTMLVSVFPIARRQKCFHRKLHNICTGKESAIRRIHLCLWWCIYDQATSVLLYIQQWSTVSSFCFSCITWLLKLLSLIYAIGICYCIRVGYFVAKSEQMPDRESDMLIEVRWLLI